MSFSEFYCNASTGSNVNAGSTESGTPVATILHGSWVSATGVFTLAGSNPVTAGIAVGMWCAVMVDAGTVAARVARVTAVDDTTDTVTLSPTIGSGSLADQTLTCTLTCGGVWKGPNAAVAFPFGFITNAAVDSSSHIVRVNFKNNAQYDITAACAHTATGPFVFQGYTTTVGDGGKFTLDGGTSGASYILLTISYYTTLADAILQNNGATGNEHGFSIPVGSAINVRNVKVTAVRGSGFHSATVNNLFHECEATACNQSNTTGYGGFYLGAASICRYCYSHDNTGSNSNGFYAPGVTVFEHCIADTNTKHGFWINWANSSGSADQCDAYNNGGAGFMVEQTGFCGVTIQNCNAVKNGAYGIDDNNVGLKAGRIYNCGFGSGTQANTSGTVDSALTSTFGVVESGSVTYAPDVTPWNDPANGDFTITLAAAKNAGRGAFLGTTSTTGYSDIGAVQHTDAGGIKRATMRGGFVN